MEDTILDDKEIQEMITVSDKSPYGQNVLVFSYVPKTEFKEKVAGMIKFRGVFSTQEQAQKFISDLNRENVDPNVALLAGQMGKWGLLKDPSMLNTQDGVDIIYEDNAQLTGIMKGFYENEQKVKTYMKERINFVKEKNKNLDSGKYKDEVKKALTQKELCDFIKLKEEKLVNVTAEMELIVKELAVDRQALLELEQEPSSSVQIEETTEKLVPITFEQ